VLQKKLTKEYAVPKTYVTFGQEHAHRINNQTFDKDCVAVIECTDMHNGRQLAFEIFNRQFCFEYHEEQFDKVDMRYFPRGLIKAN